MITGSATITSASLASRLDTIETSVGAGGGDSTAINLLQTGYTNLSTTYGKGIFFATASNESQALLGNQKGVTIQLGAGTASFSSSVSTGSLDPILSASLSGSTATTTQVKYTFKTQSYIDLTGVFTSSAQISSSVSALNRYTHDTDGVITGSNGASDVNIGVSYTQENIQYIADLATDLPGGSGETFITGSNAVGGGPVFNGDESTNFPNLVNNTNSTAQGVISFLSGSTFKFGASGSEVTITGSPTFTNLIISDGGETNQGNVTVLGSLITLQSTQLRVEDQFILVNSGAKAGGDNNTPSINDNDGGIIVGNGTKSGSMFMYDSSSNSWGFIGASGSTQQALDVQSHYQNTLVPEVTVRTIKYAAATTPPAIETLNYGNAGANTQVGTLYISTTAGEDDVFIYA
jgi:hypothetical protein